MKRPLGLILIFGLVFALTFGARRAASGNADASFADGKSGTTRPVQFLGAGSCAAAACHGSQGPHGIPRTEYPTWAADDKHARAYEVLLQPRSAAMMQLLGRPNAHKDTQCLSCHVHPGFEQVSAKMPAYYAQDGVSCESCHGAGEKWLPEHYKNYWMSYSAEEKKALGMRDTKTLAGRARLCLDCHVGTPDANVNHDLIAAGHPRLQFEFSAYHAVWKRHWPDALDKDPARGGRPDFEARAWALGQLATAQAALTLLQARAKDGRKPWLEFVELDCYACHHDLRDQGWRQSGDKDGRGRVPWSQWYVTQLPSALSAFQQMDTGGTTALVNEIGRKMADRDSPQSIAKVAREIGARLDRLTPPPNGKKLAVEDLYAKILAQQRGQATQNWDEAAQTYLALAANHNTWTDQKNSAAAARLRPLLDEWRAKLRSPGRQAWNSAAFQSLFK